MKSYLTAGHIRLKIELLVAVLLVGGLAYALITSAASPLFGITEDFVLFATEEVTLEQEVQVASGNLGSNRTLTLGKEVLVSGNLFAKKITLNKDTQINGDASYNDLMSHKGAEIFGTETTPVALPIAIIFSLAPFTTGTTTITAEGDDNILDFGIYESITLEKESTLTLTGGVYTMNSLILKEGSTIIYDAFTVINIQEELRGQNNIAILPGANLSPDDFTINYIGENQQAQGKKNDKAQAGIKPIVFGANAFLNFKLLAPEAAVHIGEQTIFRGQILAERIKVGKGSVVSREEFFSKETDVDQVVTVDETVFPVNEILLVMDDGATLADVQVVVDLVGGQIVGFIPEPQIYKIEVSAGTPEELDALIALINAQQNPLILFVLQNVVGGLR